MSAVTSTQEGKPRARTHMLNRRTQEPLVVLRLLIYSKRKTAENGLLRKRKKQFEVKEISVWGEVSNVLKQAVEPPVI